MKCPECVAKGELSSVSQTLLTIVYRCSRGHQWVDEYQSQCEPCVPTDDLPAVPPPKLWRTELGYATIALAVISVVNVCVILGFRL